MSPAILNWAIKHQITMAALGELQAMFGMVGGFGLMDKGGESEAAVTAQVRLEASKLGIVLWRNNVGGGVLEDGSFIRWGLANESKAMNAVIKSHDLIGIRPVLITEALLGHTIGQFVSREVKEAGWQYSGTDREVAQLNFAQFVNSKGGDAAFAAGLGSF